MYKTTKNVPFTLARKIINEMQYKNKLYSKENQFRYTMCYVMSSGTGIGNTHNTGKKKN
jgi:hypothetical protein